jgi:hypothetical protein
MNYFAIIGGVISVLLIYYLYLSFTATSASVSSNLYLKNTSSKTNVPAYKIIGYGNTPFSMGGWIYLNSTSGTQGGSNLSSSLFTLTDITGAYSFASVYLNASTNELKFSCYTGSNTSQTNSTPNNTTDNTVFKITNIPLQDWTCVVVSINKTYIDFYINGRLLSSQILSNTFFPPSVTGMTNNSTGMVIGNSQDLYLGQLTTWNKAVNPDEAYSYYMQGNGSGSSSSLGLAHYNFGMTVIPSNASSYSYSVY